MNDRTITNLAGPRCIMARGLIGFAVLTAGVNAFCRQVARPPATASRTAGQLQRSGVQSQAPAETKTKKKEKKDAREIAAQLVPVLARKKTPWQLYLSYQRIFYEFAAREKARKVASRQAAVYQAKLARHLQTMGDVLGAMANHAKVRKEIQRGTTSLPPEDRQKTFSEAGRQLDALLNRFVTMAKALPTGRQPNAGPVTDSQ